MPATRRLALPLVTALLAVSLATAAPAPASPRPSLLVGVGRADITPPTGYYLMGWVRSDAVARGQHTRLFARADRAASTARRRWPSSPPTWGRSRAAS